MLANHRVYTKSINKLLYLNSEKQNLFWSLFNRKNSPELAPGLPPEGRVRENMGFSNTEFHRSMDSTVANFLEGKQRVYSNRAIAVIGYPVACCGVLGSLELVLLEDFRGSPHPDNFASGWLCVFLDRTFFPGASDRTYDLNGLGRSCAKHYYYLCK
ncbi:MAG: hypothetical protein K8S27_13990 [Candidatus Omnitrophica bacterium]|nr:hypothetical protein [Candidatus Omnitrophota bacterium]